MVQNLYRRDQRAAADQILSGRIGGEEAGLPVSGEAFTDFWRSIFESPSVPLDDRTHPLAAAMIHQDLWRPTTVVEVEKARVKRNSAAGPDRITPGEWNAVPSPLVSLFFNALMACGSLPEDLTRCRTVFIKKKADPRSPADYRPISIGSVVTRHLHRILASRIQELPVDEMDPRQRAFRLRTDEVAENLCVLSTVLAMA